MRNVKNNVDVENQAWTDSVVKCTTLLVLFVVKIDYFSSDFFIILVNFAFVNSSLVHNHISFFNTILLLLS